MVKEKQDIDKLEGLSLTALFYTLLGRKEQQVDKVQQQKHRFHRELADVQLNSEINIEIDGLAKFADYFFDGLIIDWIVQSKINDSSASYLFIWD